MDIGEIIGVVTSVPTEVWQSIPTDVKDVGAIIGFLSVVASVIPHPQAQLAGIILRKLLDLGAFNFGAAKNEKKAPTLKEAIEQNKAKKRTGGNKPGPRR